MIGVFQPRPTPFVHVRFTRSFGRLLAGENKLAADLFAPIVVIATVVAGSGAASATETAVTDQF
jgi:hypothetical protein